MPVSTLLIIAAIVLFLLWILPFLFKVAIVVLAIAVAYGVYSGQFPQLTIYAKQVVAAVKRFFTGS